MTRVSIVEDDRGVRETLAALLEGERGFQLVGCHPTAEEACRLVPEQRPEVVLMDINLPRMSGIECVRRLKSTMPKLHILMLTMYEDSERIFESLKAGANGYLLKRTPPAKLLEAIEEVKGGASPMSGSIARVVVRYFNEMADAFPERATLSPRENEILQLLVQGNRYKEIAHLLSISMDTVRTHLKHIYEKLHVHSRTEAVAKYLGH
jgi:DNA-binding NarL/FixJ family response regulator